MIPSVCWITFVYRRGPPTPVFCLRPCSKFMTYKHMTHDTGCESHLTMTFVYMHIFCIITALYANWGRDNQTTSLYCNVRHAPKRVRLECNHRKQRCISIIYGVTSMECIYPIETALCPTPQAQGSQTLLCLICRQPPVRQSFASQSSHVCTSQTKSTPSTQQFFMLHASASQKHIIYKVMKQHGHGQALAYPCSILLVCTESHPTFQKIHYIHA